MDAEVSKGRCRVQVKERQKQHLCRLDPTASDRRLHLCTKEAIVGMAPSRANPVNPVMARLVSRT